ncbi:MAG TPA: flagellar basal body rod protein FlgB [Pseudolabrys sp.]|jgi:flagellar basal-body rod protein FlgB|nr:flagellar basal body rod protein FlgB [Pseudolabrys sp.]
MGLSDIRILSMLRTRLEWGQARQRVLAENVANSDTPNFRPRDLVPPKFGEPGATMAPRVAHVALLQTEPSHLAGFDGAGSAFQSTSKDNYSVRPTGNAVNLEEEMMKVAANQMDYQVVSALYMRSLGLIKTAIGKG